MAGVEPGGAVTCKRCGASVAANSICPKCGLPSNAAFASRAPTKPLVPPPPPPPGRPAHSVPPAPPAPRATGAVPPAPRPASAVVPKPKTLPATPPAARPVSNKVACALCMQSMPRETAVAVDDAVAQSLGALSAPYRGKTLCPTCLETLRAKAARAPAPSGEIPDLVAPAPSAAHSAPASPSASAVAAAASARPAAGGATAMPPHFWVAGGLAGALVGSAIYLGLHFGLDFRWAPVIILVGGLIGIGVRLGAQASTGIGPGAVAAVLTIVTGFTTSYMIVSADFAEGYRKQEEQMKYGLVRDVADKMIEEKEARGETVDMPKINFSEEWDRAMNEEGEYADNPTEADLEASWRKEYPDGLWDEAQKRWDTMPESEKEQKRKAYRADYMPDNGEATLVDTLFDFWALVWFCIAAATAFKAGAGS